MSLEDWSFRLGYGVDLSCFGLVVQASLSDCLSFDGFAFDQDSFAASEVDVSRREIVEALVVSSMIVMLDESRDLGLETLLEEVVFEQDAVLERLVPAFDFALCLWVSGSTMDLVDIVFFQPITKVGSDVTRTVAPTEERTGATEGTVRKSGLPIPRRRGSGSDHSSGRRSAMECPAFPASAWLTNATAPQAG